MTRPSALPYIYIPHVAVLSVVAAAVQGYTLIATSHRPVPVEIPAASTNQPPFLFVAPLVADPADIVSAEPAVLLVV